jgi:FlaG protein
MSTSDRPELRVDPTAPARPTQPLQAAMGGPSTPSAPAEPRAAKRPTRTDEAAVSTGGHLRPAYAQYVVDPETHEVSVRIRDAATDEVIRQIPSAEVSAVEKALRDYAEALARQHAAAQARGAA